MLTAQQRIKDIEKYKELCINEGIDIQAIDWDSWSNDISLHDYLRNEYGISLVALPEQIEDVKALIEEEKIKKGSYKENELDAFLKPNNFLIIGKKGSGKTALGFKFLSEINQISNKKAFVFDFPKPELLLKLPFHVENITTLKQLYNLTDSVCLIDEAHKYFDVLNKAVNEDLKVLLAASRQNNNCFIFITHNSYFITRGLFSYIDVRIIKEVNEGHWDMDRPHMKKLYENTNISGQEWFFIDSDFWRGREHFKLPVWFTSEFSNSYKLENATKEDFFKRVRQLADSFRAVRSNAVKQNE